MTTPLIFVFRAGSESENTNGSYVVDKSKSSFQITQENLTPHASPNPRANSRIPSLEVIIIDSLVFYT